MLPRVRMKKPTGRETALVTVAVTEAGALANLQKHAYHARGAFAASTEKALRSDSAVWSAWCLEKGLPSLPATPATLVLLIDEMAATKAPATVRRYVCSIRTLHRAAGVPNPADGIEVALALKRMFRLRGRSQRQAAPLTRPLVERLLAAAGTGLRGLRDRALLGTAYDSLARRSELSSLMCEDLEVGPDGTGTIIVRRSKTDQTGEGMVRFIAADTVKNLLAWLDAAGIRSGPLFRAVRKNGGIGGAISGADVARTLKEPARQAGLSAERRRA